MKKRNSLLSVETLFALTGCENETVLEHTFSNAWSFDEPSHWRDATCEHHVFSKDHGAHIDLGNAWVSLVIQSPSSLLASICNGKDNINIA